MDSMNLVLASQSPRRKELLSVLGLPFIVVPASIEEIPLPGETPEAFVVRAAREKGMEVASRVSQSVVLSARSEEHTSELQSLAYLVCRLLLEKKKHNILLLAASDIHVVFQHQHHS